MSADQIARAGARRPTTPVDSVGDLADTGSGDPPSLDAFFAVAEALPEVGAVVVPQTLLGRSGRSAEHRGADGAHARLAALAAALGATGKHLIARVADAREARAAAEMADVVAAGAAERPAHPLVSVVVGCEPTGGSGAVGAAHAGMPGLVSARPTPEAVADALRGIAAVQEQAPGAVSVVVLGWEPTTPLDTGGLSDLASAIAGVRSFGLPVVAEAMSTGAAGSGWRSSAENTAAALVAVMAGADAISGAGLLAGGATADAVALALDAEIASYVAATCDGIQVDDATLAVEVVEKVGIGGNYLGERHTRRNMRDVWRPRFFDRTPLEQWEREGRRGSVDLAAGFVQKTFTDRPVDPLDPEIVTELDRIARDAASLDTEEPHRP